MAVIETWLQCDLKKPVQVKQLTGNLFSLDNDGNLIGVRVTNGGQPVSLSGTVTGYCILADGQTVVVTGDDTGIRNEDKAYIILPQLAYSVPGQISIIVKLTNGSTITTLGACTGYVYRSRTSNEVVPAGTPIPDLATMEEAIRNANTAASGANSAATAANTAATGAENVNLTMSKTGKVISFTTTDRAGTSSTDTITEPTLTVERENDVVTVTATDADGETSVQFDAVDADEVSGLKSAFEQLDANVITESAGPAPIVSIADGADGMPMRSVEVAIEPVQDLHGYEYPWPAGGGVNILPTQDGTWFTSETNNIFLTESGFQLPAGTYNAKIFRNKTSEALAGFYVSTNGESYERIGSNSSDSEFVRSFTVEASAQIDLKLYCSTAGFDNAGYRVVLSTADITNSAFAPYSNVCPISGWTGAKVTRTGKNLFNIGLVNTSTGRLTVDGATISKRDSGYQVDVFSGWQGSASASTKVYLLKAGTYTISGIYVGTGNLSVRILADDATVQGETIASISAVSTSGSFTLEKDSYITLRYTAQPACTVTNLQIEPGSTATAYEPYQGQTYEITFPADPGTVYGGTLDVASGKLVVDRAVALLNDPDKWVASTGPTTTFNYEYSFTDRKKDYGNSFGGLSCSYMVVGTASTVITARWTSATGLYFGLRWPDGTLDQVKADALAGKIGIVYVLASPIVITLTPTEIKTLLGINNIWADAGNTSITYPADTKLYIDRKITEAVANALNA